jgi:Ca-activated chloride channel family protein
VLPLPEFAHPWALLALLLVPPLLWQWRRRSRGAVRFSSTPLVTGLPGRRPAWMRHGGLALRALGIVAAVTALAGPRWQDEKSRIPAEGVSIALVLDVSRSMAEEDFPWLDDKVSRLDGIKKVLRLFVGGGEVPGGVVLPGRPEDLVALVTFATRPETVCPLTLDHKTLLRILDGQEAASAVDEGTTNPGDAIAWALGVLKKAPTRRRLIVFLTDGESNVPRGLRPRQAGQLAANLGVPLYALDAAPVPADGDDAADAKKARDTLETVARMTHGAYFRARDPAALAEACRQIDHWEKDRIESFQYRRYREGFVWFAVAALACWCSVLALEATVWRTTP